MSAQLSYAINQAIAYAGLVYAQAPHDIISRNVEGASGFAFGLAVGRGTDKANQALAGGADFLGISIRSLDKEGAANTAAIKWNEKEAAGIIRDGYIWALCPTGATAGDPVNYVIATGVLDSGAAVAGENLIDGATWETDVAAGELGVIRLQSTSVTAGV